MRRLGAAAAVHALAAPAGALGVFAGTYEGKLRCRENAAGGVAKTKQDLRIELQGAAGSFAAQVFASEQVYARALHVHGEAHVDRGAALLGLPAVTR